MEYLARDEELPAHLRRGISDKWTIVHHFFFDFDVSKDMRNNFEGFIRSLLYQLTKDLKPANLPGVEPEHGWSLRTLEERLDIILKQRSYPICILLDGLDEYQGDKWELADFLRKTASSGVKLCVASRPDRVFNSAFEQIPTIKMQEWNSRAIDNMVTLRIQRDMETSDFYNHKEVVELAKGISKRAQGVFLWARFAIEELRDGWSERLGLEELQKRLENVPEELEGIYAQIFRKLRPEQRQQAASMLQLVCYAKRSLTLRELYVATAHAAGGRRPLVKQISARDMEGFEKQIFAVTGGLLELFPTRESCSSQEFDFFERSEDRSDEMMFVNVLHRTVRTYLENKDSKDSSGWSQILGTAHEGSLHAHVLWVRVCAAIFPPSFKELPAVDPQTLPSSDAQLSPTTPLGNDKRSNTTEEFSPLLEYAALFMLHHAVDVEQVVKLSSYMSLQPGMSISFLRYHRFYWVQRDTMCECFRYCPVPSHPLHLAIAHGLEGYVKEFLSVTEKNNAPSSREWDDVFYVKTDGNFRRTRRGLSGSFPISLLEFAIYHASKHRDSFVSHTRIVALLLEQYSHASKHRDSFVSHTRIVALLLEQYPHAHDAEMIVALLNSSPEVVKLLLRHWPDGKMILKSNLIQSDLHLENEFSKSDLSKIFRDVCAVGPMWYIARRVYTEFRHDDAELIDLFVRRGEDINAQCGPVGTALHSALLHLMYHGLHRSMARCLVAKGANVNESGPLGTPLEFVWRLANTVDISGEDLYMRSYVDAIGWLIESGAVNNRCDPNGSIPSRERMLSFGADGRKGVWKSRAFYRGDLIEDGSSDELDEDGSGDELDEDESIDELDEDGSSDELEEDESSDELEYN